MLIRKRLIGQGWWWLVGMLALQACSVERNNPFSKAYHNTLARYNGYFLAREEMRAVERQVLENHVDDYNRVLTIFPTVTPQMASAADGSLEEIIKKASIPIQRHKNSRWVDDSYVLLGRARRYKLDYDEAVTTFKYVWGKGEGDAARHAALVHLMRTFLAMEEPRNAMSVADYLRREELNAENRSEFFLTLAHHYHGLKEWDKVTQFLEAALPEIKQRDRRARINFILGQIYQEQGQDQPSFDHYRDVLKRNPPYELAFFTKLNMAQVTELGEGGDVRRIRKYFRRLLRDQKNEEYQDRIYYEMARFELKQDKVPEAVDYLRESVRVEGARPVQKAYSYLMLGEVHYDRLRDFNLAKV
ncbi:MAG: hypothetical protein WBA12_06870, partial [Catalinimonas sp.]